MQQYTGLLSSGNLRTLAAEMRGIATTLHPLLKCYYNVLGLHKNCTQNQIKESYFKLSKLYHPDRNDSVDAIERFREITDAYDVLKNVKTRQLYDEGQLQSADRNAAYQDRDMAWQDKTQSFYKQRARRESPTGRSANFNYDEWERMHYGSVFQRRQRAKARYEQWEADRGEDVIRKEQFARIMYLLLTSMGFLMVCITLDVNDYDQPKPIHYGPPSPERKKES